jgi:hypothetical protein
MKSLRVLGRSVCKVRNRCSYKCFETQCNTSIGPLRVLGVIDCRVFGWCYALWIVMLIMSQVGDQIV